MTQLDFDQILSSIDALSPEQLRLLIRKLDSKPANAAKPVGPPLGSLGAMSDASNELDAIVEQTTMNRRERPK